MKDSRGDALQSASLFTKSPQGTGAIARDPGPGVPGQKGYKTPTGGPYRQNSGNGAQYSDPTIDQPKLEYPPRGMTATVNPKNRDLEGLPRRWSQVPTPAGNHVSPPYFAGDGRDHFTAKEWCQMVQRFAANTGVRPSWMLTTLAKEFLKGPALHYVQKLPIREGPLPFNKLEGLLREYFPCQGEKQQAAKRLERLKLTGITLAEYKKQFGQLLRRANAVTPMLSEAQVRDRFLAGMPPALLHLVAQVNPTTWTEAAKIAEAVQPFAVEKEPINGQVEAPTIAEQADTDGCPKAPKTKRINAMVGTPQPLKKRKKGELRRGRDGRFAGPQGSNETATPMQRKPLSKAAEVEPAEPKINQGQSAKPKVRLASVIRAATAEPPTSDKELPLQNSDQPDLLHSPSHMEVEETRKEESEAELDEEDSSQGQAGQQSHPDEEELDYGED